MLQHWILVTLHLPSLTDVSMLTLSPDINCGLYRIMTCWYMFARCSLMAHSSVEHLQWASACMGPAHVQRQGSMRISTCLLRFALKHRLLKNPRSAKQLKLKCFENETKQMEPGLPLAPKCDHWPRVGTAQNLRLNRCPTKKTVQRMWWRRKRSLP